VPSFRRAVLSCWQVFNKIDQISIEEVDRLARETHSVVVRSVVVVVIKLHCCAQHNMWHIVRDVL